MLGWGSPEDFHATSVQDVKQQTVDKINVSQPPSAFELDRD